MRIVKWMALVLALCLMVSAAMPGLTEAPEEGAPVDAAMALVDAAPESDTLPEGDPTPEDVVAPAESVGSETGLTVEGVDSANGEASEDNADAPADDAAVDAVPADDMATVDADNPAEPVEDAAPASMYYAEVAAEEAAVYQQTGDWEAAAMLHAGDVVLATGASGGFTDVAFYADGAMLSGCMNALDLLPMDDAAAQAYLDNAAASGAVALYNDDLNWPLVPLANVVYGDDRAVLASSNYTDYSIDTVYTLNGKQISASMVPDTGSGNCWKWAQGIYELVWGCKFSETFAGNANTGLNLLSNLNDSQRELTPEHLKVFIQNTTPGATIRICACTSSCGSFNNDGLACGHNGHSLIVVDKNENGVFTMDSHSNSQHTRFYSWQGFCNAWKGYTYVKYIKWPGAQPLAASAISDGNNTIAVTGVTLNKTAMVLTVGGTETLTATVEPADATNKSVEWASSNEAVATVANGVVTAVKDGTATIAVKTADGGKIASCTLTVKRAMQTKALSKTGSNGTVVLGLGEQLQLSADFAANKGWTLKSAKSSKKKVATIDGTGVVTALAVGKTKITVTTTNKKKATLTVQVVDPTVPSAVALNRKGTVKLKVGETLKLEAAILPTTATTTYQWKSSKPKVATVDENGNVVAVKKGSCTVAVRTANGKIAKVKIKVTK